MAEVQLLAFGCAVGFVAVGGAYLYLRESFMATERPLKAENRRAETAARRRRDVAAAKLALERRRGT